MKIVYILITAFILSSPLSTAQSSQYNPEKEVNPAEYNEVFQKFKKLYIAKLDSESHIRFAVLSKAFTKKMGFYDKVQQLLTVKNPLEWVKANLEKTSFNSYEEAENEWAAILAERELEVKENQEYYTLLYEIIRIPGSNILADVIGEIQLEYPEKFNIPESFPRRPGEE